ncbi:MAG: nucleoside triphosphate pyrophosphohydrolase [Terriglobia bacterium]
MPDQSFSKLVDLMARLRGPDGCPWDRAQNYDSVKGLMLEEAYEVVDAINGRDYQGLEEELGDLLFQVIFYSRLAEEENRFTIDDVTRKLHEKLVRRHPHVFGGARAGSAEEALESWLRVKESEQKAEAGGMAAGAIVRNGSAEAPERSILDGIPRRLPALLETHEIGNRAAENGFDWPDIQSLLDKVEEEIHELRLELEGAKHVDSRRVEEEVGDLLFAVSNVARYLRSDPESCLRRANQKFTLRFKALEARASERGKVIRDMDARELDALWNAVKRAERVTEKP